MRIYFDYFYNPVYDITTAPLNQYRKLQTKCVEKLDLRESDRVLCVGLGTGNELVTILKKNRNINITGVDYSQTALKKASKKAKALGKSVELLLQDARKLEFTNGSFDKVLCIHVTDFINEDGKVTAELLRVLKNGGTFVITYPSSKENAQMGLKLFTDSARSMKNSGKSIFNIFLKSFIQAIVTAVYLPLLLRSNRKTYKRGELEELFNQSSGSRYSIEEDTLYQDFIVYGRK
jgi:ubiquinone/menaquinone biosynthesis C-methylase UbiE